MKTMSLTSGPGTPTDLWEAFQSLVCWMALIGCITETSDDAISSLFYNNNKKLE